MAGNSPSKVLTQRITAHDAARLDRYIDERRPGVLGELRQRSIDMEGGFAPHWLLESPRGATDPSARLSASSKDWSDVGFEGELKSMSKQDCRSRRPGAACR